MIRVPANLVAADISRFQRSAKIEPVVLIGEGGNESVLISADEFHRLKRRDRTAGLTEDLSDEVLHLIETTEMDPRHDYLNALLLDDSF